MNRRHHLIIYALPEKIFRARTDQNGILDQLSFRYSEKKRVHSMTKHPRYRTMKTLIPVLIVVPIMVAFLLVVPASAGTVHAESPGWKFNATETPVINPATGIPFPSMGALEQALYPGLWNTMSPAARSEANNTPAISRSFDLSYTLNASRQAVSKQVEARSVTEAEYLSNVLPDLWAAIPEWQKEQYRNEQHRSLSSSLAPVNGQFTGPFFPSTGSFNHAFGSYDTGFRFGNTNTPTWETGSSWLSLGNTGNPTGEAASSWLTPGQIPPAISLISNIPVVPVDFKRHTVPFSSTGVGRTTDQIPRVELPPNPFETAGISPAGNTFSGLYRVGWSAV
jgi:hypothetical protein